MNDKERLEQIRREGGMIGPTAREKLEQVRKLAAAPCGLLYGSDARWLLDRLDALGKAIARFADGGPCEVCGQGVVRSMDIPVSEWVVKHRENCPASWAKEVYGGEPDAAGGEEG